MATTIITDIFATLDTVGESFISNAFQGLALQVTAVFGSMLTLYVVWWGYMILAAREGFSVPDAAWKLGRAFFIYFMATNWAAFSQTLYKLIQVVPETISDTIIQAIAGNSGMLDGGSASTTGVVRILDAVFETAVKVYEQVATGTFEFVGALIGAVVFVVAMLFIAVGAASIVAAKLMLFITLALAPVFIILALYRWTFSFTDGWLRLLSTLVITQVLNMAFLAFFYQLIAMSIIAAEHAKTDSKLSFVAPFVLVCLLGIVVFRLLPNLAAAISGGAALGGGTSAASGALETLGFARRQIHGRAHMVQTQMGKRRMSEHVYKARERAIQRETQKNGLL